MPGYQCAYHDGPADAEIIYQVLGEPGVTSVCRDCAPLLHITMLAGELGVDTGDLYDHVRAFQLDSQGDVANRPQPEDAQPAGTPAGPHPAAVMEGGEAILWDWCACDAPGPHNQHGEPLTPGNLGQLREDPCPHCGERIRGTLADIDSGLRKHIEYCERAPHPDEETTQ